jgi:hypothetical protein
MEHDIIPIYMPAQLSHLLQPLDVGCFAPLKRAYGRAVANWKRLGFNHIDKFDFLEVYPKAHMEAFRPENIQNGFAAAGLVPLNPECVLSQLNIQRRTPTAPPSRSPTPAPEMLYDLDELNEQASTIKKLLQGRPWSTTCCPVNTAFIELIKGVELALDSTIILVKEHQDLRAVNGRVHKKRTRPKRRSVPTKDLLIENGHFGEAIQTRPA